MRVFAWMFPLPPRRERRPPSLALPPPALPDDAEPFEWPPAFGDRMPDLDAFVDWCGDVGIDGFQSIKSLRIAHDEFALMTGRQHVTDLRMARLVTLSDRIEKWRDRRHGNATRYRIIRQTTAAMPLLIAA